MDVPMTFEAMLKEWFEQKLFSFTSDDAKTELVRVLESSNCTRRVVKTIQDISQKENVTI